MEVICTPSHGPLAIIVNTATGDVIHEVPMPHEMRALKNRPFGIAHNGKGNWYIASNAAIATLNSHFLLTHLQTGLPENIHQLYHDPVSQELWVVATSIDSLLAINTENHTTRRFCLLTDKWIPFDAPGSDTQHFNSITWYDDRFYIVAHRLGKGSSFVRTYDRAMHRTSVWQAGREAHNILEYGDQLVLLDSRGGRIVSNKGIDINVCEPHHYARGMVISPEGIAIVAVFEFGNRDTRNTGDAYLRAFDLRSGQKVQDIVLTGTGNIQDIKWRKAV